MAPSRVTRSAASGVGEISGGAGDTPSVMGAGTGSSAASAEGGCTDSGVQCDGVWAHATSNVVRENDPARMTIQRVMILTL